MTTLYRNESSDPKRNAQRNLIGRTHYVDDDTLRFHKARVLSARAVDNGLLFAIVESVAITMDGSKRGFRYVIFDLFGCVVGTRAALEDSFKSHDKASKAMWDELNTLDAKEISCAAIERAKRRHAQEMEDLKNAIDKASNRSAP